VLSWQCMDERVERLLESSEGPKECWTPSVKTTIWYLNSTRPRRVLYCGLNLLLSVGLQGSCVLPCILFCILTPNYDFGVADDYSALLGYHSAIEPYEGSLRLT
jgi:hypothetical protein